MTVTTTTYGTFYNHTGSISVESYVADAFGSECSDGGGGSEGYDVLKIVADFRTAINEALPECVSLCENEFYGPYHQADRKFEGYPLTGDGGLNISEIVEGIDFWEIVARHDLSDQKSYDASLEAADQQISHVNAKLDKLIEGSKIDDRGTTEAIAYLSNFLLRNICHDPEYASQLIAVAVFRLSGRL